MSGDAAPPARAMSEEAMLASLRDLTLPIAPPGGLAAEIAVTVGLAGCAALLVVAVLRLLSVQPAAARKVDATDGRSLQDVDLADATARRIALLRHLRDKAPARYASLRGDLYRPGGVSLERLEAEARAHG